jgi:hypothetical protein
MLTAGFRSIIFASSERYACHALQMPALCGSSPRPFTTQMNGRFTALHFVALFLLAGCASDYRASRVSSPAASATSPAQRLIRIEEHFDRLEVQCARVERLQRRASLPQHASPGLRARFAAYRQAECQQRSFYVSHGITLDADYYRLQHELLDAFSASLHRLEVLLTRTRNERSA